MEALWTIAIYVVTNVTDNTVIGAEPDSSRHPWQGKVPASGNFYDPTCFVGSANALWTLVRGVSLVQLLGSSALGPRRVVSALGHSLVGVTWCTLGAAFYGVTEVGVGRRWLSKVPDGVSEQTRL